MTQCSRVRRASVIPGHDISTKSVLAATLAEAISLDEPAVVIDLSGVHFISAATIGVIVAAKELQARRGRALVLRAPPSFVQRAFDACSPSDVIDLDPIQTMDEAGVARGSWVELPTTGHVDLHDTPVSTGPCVGERASVESGHAEHPSFVRIP
jgi:anti-anti-sigma factor